MYLLHIGNKNYSSWSLRPWVLMRGLGIEFEERLHRFGPGFQTSLQKLSPSGRVPALSDGDVAVWDSLAIVEYLAERHRGVWPEDSIARAWARCASAEMHSGFSNLRQMHTMNVGVRVKVSQRSAELVKDIQRIEALWSEGFAKFRGPFLAGAHFSAVDAFFAPVVFRFQTYGWKCSGEPAAYVNRMLEFPAMRQWQIEALAETFRDPAHDVELKNVGEITADLRAAPA